MNVGTIVVRNVPELIKFGTEPWKASFCASFQPATAIMRSALSNFERGVFDPTLKFDPGGFSAHFGLSRGA